MPTYLQQMEALAARQGGYFYPWRSTVGAGDGESAYGDLVDAHLRPDMTVLEAGCGHGPDVARFAPRVARYIAYDYARPFIEIAESVALNAKIENCEFHVVDSSPARGGRLPVGEREVDLIISRRGPTNFILDASRACRSGALLIQLNPAPTPTPAWNESLPPALRIAPPGEDIEARVAGLLARAGLCFSSADFLHASETFADPAQLWLYLSFLKDDAPSLADVAARLDDIFRQHAGPEGLELRHRRFLWTAHARGESR